MDRTRCIVMGNRSLLVYFLREAMEPSPIRVCQCPTCQQAGDHPDKQRHRQINTFVSCLDEQQRRWYAAIESERIGYGGDRLLAQITGLDEKTIRRGRQELAA